MKWSIAVQRIESALAEGKEVEVRYHRRYNTKISLIDKVDMVIDYKWHGVPEHDISTWRDQLSDYSHIIDEIIVKEEAHG